MIVLLAVLLAVFGVATILLALHAVRPSPSLLGERVCRTVIVTLKSGAAFRGALHSADRDVLVLRNAQALDRRGEQTPVDGEVLLPRSEVEFLQRP